MNQNFVKVNQNQLDVDIDLRYASKNNFTGNKIYFSESCFLHKIAFEHLCKAVNIAKKIGFRIKYLMHTDQLMLKIVGNTLRSKLYCSSKKRFSSFKRCSN